ncbi:MAG: hypothetical protein ACR2GR_03960 [Rhodothermales bacterium]
MPTPAATKTLLVQEAQALLTRLARVKPFALTTPMATAAAPSPAAQKAVERYLVQGRRHLRGLVLDYLKWLNSPVSDGASPAEVQRRFVLLKLLFNKVLTQFDLFADVLMQRSEHGNGVWLAGLDVAAADALELRGRYYEAPPVICYLDRGHGAAIRRARTRLPGGGENPVAIVRVPRERMVGSGIAASLLHEVGHQGIALLGLIDSVREDLRKNKPESAAMRQAWPLWDRWISEIIADVWALAHLGIGSTLGLIGVVSLPRAFVFRVGLDDPHPIPWVRVKLSCAVGRALFPHPQWARLDAVWEAMYPLDELEPEKRQLFDAIMATLPRFVRVLLHHRPKSLRGRSLKEVLPVAKRQPAQLQALYQTWKRQPVLLRRQPPSLVFAVIGQARSDGKMTPDEESRALMDLVNYWALRDTLNPPEKRIEQVRRTRALAV